MQEIYSEKGVLKGFYSGSLPNLGRIVAKNIYRYPLMIGMPQVFEKRIADRRVQKFFTGLSIAFIESFILCPFERLKVYFMTYSHKEG
jgi:hypothetical protein